MAWNNLIKIAKTRKPHLCACTGKAIPKGSSCWKFVGDYEGEFQSWYMSQGAKSFIDSHPELAIQGFECSEVGYLMQEEGYDCTER